MTQVSVGSLKIDYETRGSGPPLLMVPGFRRSRVVWLEPLLSALEQHFRLILIDNRGTGNSDKPESGYSIEAFADDAARLLAAIGVERANVFGVSMGGMITQRIATRHPQLVMRVAIGCSHCGKSGSVPPEARIWELLRLMPDETMDAREVAYRQEEAYVTDEFRAANREVLDELFEIVNRNPTPPHGVAGHLAAIDSFDACGDLESIAAPALLITGTEDRLVVAENSRLMARKIPGAQLVELPAAGHFFWIEKPRETATALTAFFQGGAPE